MNQTQEDANKIKLIAVGDSGVGKTSIISRFIDDKFDEFSEPTLGAAFVPKRFALSDGKSVEFHLWDTAGQQKYKSIAPIYYRQAKAAICVYDICSSHSFDVMKTWVDELKNNGPQGMIITIVGNKIDRYDDEEVNYNQVKQYAAREGALLKLVSAKQGKNINDLFTSIAEKVFYNSNPNQPIVDGGKKISDKKGQENKKKCC